MALFSGWALMKCAAAYSILLIILRAPLWWRTRHIPGPPVAGISGLWFKRANASGRLCSVLEEAGNKYGPLVKVAPGSVLCSDPKETRRVWRPPWRRSDWYRGLRLDPSQDSMLSVTDTRYHNYLRCKVLPGYHGKGIDGFHERIDEQILNLISLITSKYTSSDDEFRPIDWSQTTPYLSQDIISSVGFSSPFGHLLKDDDVTGYIRASHKFIPLLMSLTVWPKLVAFSRTWLAKPITTRVTNKRGFGLVLGIVRKLVNERYLPDKAARSDILQTMIESGLSREEVYGEALLQLVGGTDTLATALRAIMLYIATSPLDYNKVQNEIDKAIASGVHRPVIGDTQARALPYLGAVIKEGLRCFPPIPALSPKVCDKDTYICGHRIPAGTQVVWGLTKIMHNRGVFGEDADIFNPNRWLKVPPKARRDMDATLGLVFGAGSRWECAGKSLALTVLYKSFFELLCRFDFQLLNPLSPWKSKHYASFIQSDMKMKITKRARD